MADSIYAKTYYENNKPVGESLEVHVGHLMDNLDELKALYKEEIENLVDGDNKQFWDSLGLCVLFHDCGKISTHFQNKIRSRIGEHKLKHKAKLNGEIPHNYLSPAFLPEGLDALVEDDFFKIFFTIAFHHDRNIGFDKEYLKKVIEDDLQKIIDTNKDVLSWLKAWLKEYGYTLPSKLWPDYLSYLEEGKYNRYNSRYAKIRKEKSYILLKGLFHRLDYSASAHQPVELERIANPDGKLLSYLRNKLEADGFAFRGLKDFQAKAKDYRDKSVLLTASTGMGKTEFAINWIGTDKAFYTLPLRVSVNAMYERFVKIFSKDKVGLVHSDSLLYGIEEKIKQEHIFNIDKAKQAKQFAFPTTITTADQLFTSVFKWPGYEMIYATLMYSKVILDEPQSYSPETLAVIVKALEEISSLGGKFCFMSATIHPYVKKHLKEVVNIGPIYHEEDKHCISLVEKSIEELSDQIKGEFNNGKKVLVICNTVKKAQGLYKALDIPSKKLLHGGFIKKHRSLKEIEIQEDYKREEKVVWITTQIVEASLDIDYDILFTELASIDSLLQRMGRVYRFRNIDKGSPANVFIATKEPSDGYKIYDKTVVLLTLEVLIKYNNNILKEKEKLSLMDKVFGDKEKVKDFYKRFKDSYDLLENGFETEDKKQAQKLFRDIASMTVIPKPIYEENEEELDNLVDKLTSKARLDYRERLLATQKIDSFTLNIPIYKASTFVELLPKRGIFKADIDYDAELGILVNKKVEGGENII